MATPSFTWDFGHDFRFLPWDQIVLWPKPLTRVLATMSWPKLENFLPHEFDSPDEPGSGLLYMDHHFVMKLDQLRTELGFPMRINSGYRTAAHNKAVGGKQSSAHRKGLGADVHCLSSGRRFLIAECALEMGFKRVGIGKTFLHLDASTHLPQKVIWLY